MLAQEQAKDSLDKIALQKEKIAKHKIYSGPRKATIMSAILPGLGQAYNHKYWKVPIIYGALGTMVYIFKTNNDQYNYFRNNLLKQVKDPKLTFVGGLSLENNQKEKNRYKKYRDFSAIGILGIYLLNIIDANVDAHLKTFDVSDNLSLQIKPWFQNQALVGIQLNTGLSFKFTLK